jgi:CoA:oxalate CoA-transferase
MGSMSSAARTPSAPLHGVAVLDFTRVLSGPHCTRMLADLGADVIKLEPPAGDLTRFSTPRRHGIASYFAQQNAGKRNISIDLSSEVGIGIVLDLAERVDVVLENYRPGVMDRLGLGAEVLMARNPRLIVASISGYGQDGPWVHRRAYAPVVEAETGIIASQGRKRGELAKDPHSHADLYTALQASSAILAALYQRTHTGVGQRIDVSMAETMMYDNEHMHDALWDGETDPGWIRSFQPDDYVVLTVANGESLIVSGHPAERGTFDLFAAAMGREDLIDDERFATVESRLAHMDELTSILADFAATVADPVAFEEIFAQHRLAVGRVRAPGELADTEWGRQRNVTVAVDDRHGGSIAVPNVPWRFSAAPDVAVEPVVRYRGEDNRAVLAEMLGYDTDRIDALERDGVLSSRVPDTAR